MKTPNEHNGLPPELDELLEKESASEAARLREVWDMALSPDDAAFPSSEKLDTIWKQLDAEVDSREDVRILGKHSSNSGQMARIIPMRWMAIAATILIGAAGLGYWLKPLEATAPLGEMATVYLEDGTRVDLNSGASLKYGRSFGDTRRVYLDGEAFFDVKKEDRPFVVETFNARVNVLGTSFNVRAWHQDVERKTTVALQTGRVHLESVDKSIEPVFLDPGEQARVSVRGVHKSEADTVLTNRSASWREGDFFFSEEWLGSVLSDVARRFDTQIRVEKESIRRNRVKLSLKQPNSEEVVLENICTSLGLKYRETAEGYEVFDPR